MAERESWAQLRDRRMAGPGAAEAYEAAWPAFELGAAARDLREPRSCSAACPGAVRLLRPVDEVRLARFIQALLYGRHLGERLARQLVVVVVHQRRRLQVTATCRR
jgi:hypothetical protein